MFIVIVCFYITYIDIIMSYDAHCIKVQYTLHTVNNMKVGFLIKLNVYALASM